jgi:hypothetical protein
VLNIEFFVRALKMRWPRLEWIYPTKIWVGHGNPCADLTWLVYAATKITMRNGVKTPFWDAPWLNGLRPSDLALLVFMISLRKKWNPNMTLANDGLRR